VITGDVLRRPWTIEQKLRIIEESFEPGESVSSAARRHGVAPNLIYRWRRLLSEVGTAAVDSDEPVRQFRGQEARGPRSRAGAHPGSQGNGSRTPASCLLQSRLKKISRPIPLPNDGWPMNTVADVLKVFRFNLAERARSVRAARPLRLDRGCRSPARHSQARDAKRIYWLHRHTQTTERRL